MYRAMFRRKKRTLLFQSALLIAAVAFLDWQIVGQVPLGILYLVPMAMLGSVLEWWQICVIALLCTGLAEVFDDLQWNLRAGTLRDVLYFVVFTGAGLFIREITRNRQTISRHVEEVEQQSEARRLAEEQFRVLVETSPSAIFVAERNGSVLMANEAAHRMLGLPAGRLTGRFIYKYFPSLQNLSGDLTSLESLRSVMQARAQRDDGETFLADISFSTYRTNAGLRLAAMVMDASEELRIHEVSGLHQLLAGSRIAIGAVSHEIRNVCRAITDVHRSLARNPAFATSKDFEALGHLIEGLERIAKLNLRQTIAQPEEVDLPALLEELRIVISPSFEEEAIAAEWSCDPELPAVWADRPSLMQVFLNLLTNSIRAMANRPQRKLSVSARTQGDRVLIEFVDSGGGVAHPESLFRPFHDDADSSGLGLYISRAFLHSFGGELQYLPVPGGACFIVCLSATIQAVWTP